MNRNPGCLLIFLAAIVCPVGLAVADWNPEDGHKMHYPQMPDPTGWDVSFGEGFLGDDWKCSETGLVHDLHFWISWRQDMIGEIIEARVAFYSDDRSGPYSKPGFLLWQSPPLFPGQFQIRPWGAGPQGWYEPLTQLVMPDDHQQIFQVNIFGLEEFGGPFIQEEGIIYWVVIRLEAIGGQVGWKTSGSPHFEDDAVWQDFSGLWRELVDPFTGESLDLAFVITGEEICPPDPKIEFSLDIGSDVELSDPKQDGNEGFDPATSMPPSRHRFCPRRVVTDSRMTR